MRTNPLHVTVALAVTIAAGCTRDDSQPFVAFTWLSNTTWLIEADGVHVFVDAALTRWDFSLPDLTQPESLALDPVPSDTALAKDVLRVLGADSTPTYIVVGHGHSDHTIDLGTFARLTGAEIVGARTACLQAEAQGIAPGRCHVVEGGEVIELTPRLEVRVVRWAHSGNPSTRLGRFIQAPKELRARPPVDPGTGAMGPAPWQGYPNGGGARAYLFTLRTPGASLAWLVSDTGNSLTFDSIPQIGSDYLADVGVDLSGLEFVSFPGSPRRWVSDAVRQSGLDSIDLWIGYGGDLGHVRHVETMLPSRYFIPHHWDAYFSGFRPGVTRRFERPGVEAYLDSTSVGLFVPVQYLDRYELTATGLRAVPNNVVQEELGLVAR